MRAFGKYRLIEPLATGGMAEVWRAEVAGAEGVVKEVALKLVRGEYEADSEFVRMFVQEARLAARLGHGNVVQVFEFDQVDGRYYIAMELVRGRHLGRVMERARERGVRIGVPRAVHVAAEVARALAYAHRLSDAGRPLGLVHRDVSPHNVLVSLEGEVKLADFGIARAMNLAEATAPGTIKGKAAYMAPEQARGAAVDARADVFSLGVVLWELCTGRRLFARESEAAAIAAVLSPEPVSPPSAWNEEVPPDLDRAVLGALEKDPERRTASAQDLATALSSVLLRVTRSPEDADLRGLMHRLFPEAGAPPVPAEPTRVRPVPLAAEPVAEPTRRTPAEESETRTAPEPPRRRVPARAVAAAGVVLAAAAAGIALLRAGAPARPQARSAAPDPPAEVAGGDPPSPAREAPFSPAAVGARGVPEAETGAADAPPARRPEGAGPVEGPDVEAEGRAPRAAKEYGTLKVISTPWGRLIVDGKRLGDTPRDVVLPAGWHRVVVSSPNPGKFDSAAKDVEVKPGKVSTLNVVLKAR